MDIIDRAAQIEQEFREAVLSHRARTQATSRVQKHGQQYCVDCKEEIPVARRQANPHAIRCIDCQNDFERGNK